MRVARIGPLALLLTMPWFHVSAQTVAALEGTWRMEPTLTDTISRAIDRAVEPMNPFVRMIARRRLSALNPAFQHVRLARVNGDTLGITWGRDVEARALPGALASPYSNTAGERMSIRLITSASPAPWLLEETYVTADGTRTNRWIPRPDGLLDVRVTVSGPRLPRELSYRLVYRRQGSAP